MNPNTPTPELTWSIETMRLINNLMSDIKGKAVVGYFESNS